MKIICIGTQLRRARQGTGQHHYLTEPVVFMKPPSAMIPPGAITLPSFSDDVHHEIELVYLIARQWESHRRQSHHRTWTSRRETYNNN
jgi:2-keto-4-pentenoate hydratase/2-oxohepta-3-ene-1,7-dioic acid hydratase in catechol pathway